MALHRRTALFICGSINQTSQLHQVANALPEVDAFFTPFYGDRAVDTIRRLGLSETSIGGNKRRGWCLDYLRDHELRVDMHGRAGGHALVVTCSDLVVPKNVRGAPLVLVQEGILDPPTIVSRIVRRIGVLPRWVAGTEMTGLSGLYHRFCVASDGYKKFFVRRGASAARVVVTGIPNFDDCRRFLANQFPHRGYVLVCTSDARETFKHDDRDAFIRRALRIAAGRKLVFKLHPNEDATRATREIHAIAPSALVFAKGEAEPMIANADVVVTQWSSTAFVALALGKELHSNFPLDELTALVPVQNGGQSARNIARVCRDLLRTPTHLHEARSRRGEPAEASGQ